jgi:diguanylate cyclase (GGDEF)-like protein
VSAVTAPHRPAVPSDFVPPRTLSALDGLVSLARLGRTAARLDEFLSAVTETAATTVGFRVAAFNLYRPADDDYIVTSVVGTDRGERELVGTTVPGAWSRRIFHEAFEVERVYFVPEGSIDWDEDDSPAVYTPDATVASNPDPWRPLDALVAPLTSSNGETLGFLSFDDPIDGRRPTPRRLKALAAVAAQAAVTVEQRQAERATAAHSAVLEHLVGAATSLAGLDDEQSVLDTLAHVLRTSLGFGHLVTVHGAALTEAGTLSSSPAEIVQRVRAQVVPDDGTYLLSPAVVEQLCPDWAPPRSRGEGRRAWGGHLLLLPLSRADGTLAAVVRLAQPSDRLLPGDDRIALIGLLAAQATAGIENAAQQLLRHQRDRAVHLARHDEATGLPNRRALAASLDARIDASTVCAILAIGLDEFAIVREALGHDHGEATLRAVAARLDKLAGQSRLYRLEGDVLGVLVDGALDQALVMADRCSRALAEPFEVAGSEHRVGGTIGIAAVVGDAAETLRHADVARLHARRERRSSSVYDATIDDAAFRLARVGALRLATGRGELELHYQPIVDARTRAIAGIEALVRWRFAGRLIPPLEWIGLAESSGLIDRVGAWVVDAAAAQARAWIDAGLEVPPINVNVAPRQLRGGRLAETIGHALSLHGLPPTAMIAELTESGLQPDARVNAELEALAALGVRTAVDDFGADYSSLSRLRELPVSMLKVDRAFLRDVPADPRAIDLVHAIMGLGSALGVQVVVEGVEHEAQAQLLASAPPNVLWQGFLQSRPVPPDELALLLRRADPSR